MSATVVPPRRSALVVVDVQESFRHRPYFVDDELPSFFDRCRTLVDGFEAAGLPVIRIVHVEPTGPFSHASGLAVPMRELDFDAAAAFEKSVHSALVGTGLPRWLTAHGVTRLAIAGIRTEQCCETTTRHASDVGFDVDYVTEATLTFPMTTAAGRVVSSAEIRERTELVLAGRFATIATAEQAVRRAVAAAAGTAPD